MTPSSVPRAPFAAAALAALAAVSPVVAAAQRGEGTGRLVGRIVDARTGQGLSDAHLEVEERGIGGPASADGRFLVPALQPGPIVLTVRRTGYLTRSDTLDVVAGRTLELRIALSPDPVELDPIVVDVRMRILEAQGFYSRRRQGFAGFFFTGEEIEERGPDTVTDLLMGLPGVRILPGGLDGAQVVFQRAISTRDSGVCRPALFLDGVKSQIRLYDVILDPAHVAGVEVYIGAGIPGRFNDPCGAVLIWTRLP